MATALRALGVAAIVAVAHYVAFGPSYVNYDAQYALLWARDAWTGFAPEYEAPFAPTPHPLATAVSSVALPFGHSADLVILWLVLLLFGGLVYVTYRLGTELFGTRWVGIVAAAVVLTRPAIERDALLAYQDIPFALLVVAAVLLEAQRPKRGVPVFVLLALAGLLRPEAWVLSGLYWIYCAPSLRTAALVAAAPAVWAFTDWLVTGDLLHSLHGTADLAEENERRRSPSQVPYWSAQYLGAVLREPLVIGVPIGLAFAWFHARRQALLPAATVAAMMLVFAIGPFFGLPLIRRYVDTPAVLLILFYALAVAGWTLMPGARWRVVGALALGLSIAYLPWHAKEWSTVERRLDLDGAFYADLQATAESPSVQAAFQSCQPLVAGDHRPVPFIRFWLDGDPGSVTTPDQRGRMMLLPRRGPTTRRIYNDRAGTWPQIEPPEGWQRIDRNRSWRVYAEPGCVRRPPS